MPVLRAFSIGDLGRALHHEVAHAVVAVDQRHAGVLVHDTDVRAAG